MFCRQCGTELSEDAAYCGQCGAKVIKAETDNTVDRRDVYVDSAKKSQREIFDNLQKTPTWLKCLIGIIAAVVIGFCIWLLILILRWVISSFVIASIVFVIGYILYHKVLAPWLTERSYNRISKELQLPEGMTASMLLEALSGKFNYPYFKGVHYGTEGECVIEGKYSMYPVTFYEDNITEISYISEGTDTKKRTVLLETMAIQDYINKFFNPNLPIDVIRDMKRLNLAEGQRKAVAFVCAAATVLIVAATVWDYVSPGSLQSMAVPGIEVRTAYLSEYSTQVTIGEAFEGFFDNCKWTKFDSEGYAYVAFTGTCRYFDERADVRITFKITGEKFIVDSLDINGRTQSDLVLYGLLSAVYEDY